MDDETLKKEFIFLKNALKEIARDLSKSKPIDAAFALGVLYNQYNDYVFKMNNKTEEAGEEGGPGFVPNAPDFL